MTVGGTGSGWGAKRRLRLRVTLFAGVEYVATCAFLLAYWLIGKASGPTTLALFAYSAVANLLILLAIASGWSERLRDPSMTAIQMVVSCGRDLLGCYFMPGVWFVFVFNLFIALPFGSLQFDNRLFARFWLGTCAGLGLVFIGYPRSLEIGFATAAEKGLFWLFISAALARLMLFNSRISLMRRNLRAKAVELAQAVRRMERERVARELHDAVLQTHFGLVFQLTALVERLPADSPQRAEMEATLRGAEQALSQGREHVLETRSEAGADRTLVQLLRQAGDDLAYDTGLAFHLHVPGDEIAFTDDARAAIQAILLQALANAFHHSQGRNVCLELGFWKREFTAAVLDDGRGMPDDGTLKGSASRFGVPIMRAKAEKLGAGFSIEARASGGTEVRLVVPAPSAYDLPRPLVPRWLAWLVRRGPRG